MSALFTVSLGQWLIVDIMLKGAGQVGFPETDARITDSALVQTFVDLMTKRGHVGVDTSRAYTQGTSEKVCCVSQPSLSLYIHDYCTQNRFSVA